MNYLKCSAIGLHFGPEENQEDNSCWLACIYTGKNNEQEISVVSQPPCFLHHDNHEEIANNNNDRNVHIPTHIDHVLVW